MSCLSRSICTSTLSICPHHHRSGRLHRLFPSLLHLARTRSVQPIMCDPLGSRDIHRQGLGAFLLATGLLASCCVASSRRNISPLCPLHHCSYNVIPHGSTIVLRNLCCVVHPHKVSVLLIRSSSLFWSATCEREAATDPVHKATVAEPPHQRPTFELLSIRSRLNYLPSSLMHPLVHCFFIQHNQVVSVAISSPPTSSASTIACCANTFYLAFCAPQLSSRPSLLVS